MVVLNGVVAIKPGSHLSAGDIVLVNDLPQPLPLEVIESISMDCTVFRMMGCNDKQRSSIKCMKYSD